MKSRCYLNIPVLLIVFAIQISCSQKATTDWNMYLLNGKVKTYTENFYAPVKKSGSWQKGKPQKFGNNQVYFSANGVYEQMDFLDQYNTIIQRVITKQANGKATEELVYDRNEKLLHKVTFTYVNDTTIEAVTRNTKGEKLVSRKTFLKDNRVDKIEYKEFKDGNVTFDTQIKMTYGDHGLASHYKQVSQDGYEVNLSYEYLEFDAQNNWIKRLEYNSKDNKTPERIVIRTYEYYEE